MRDMMKILFVIFILSAHLLTACNVIRGDTRSSDSAALESKTWILVSYGEEGRLEAVLEGTEITATFNPSEIGVRGSSGCNQYFGDYEVNGGELSISNVAVTEMACPSPEGVMDQEQLFLSMFVAAERFQVQEDHLTIFSANGQLLKFR